jgi:hypothetical protein
MEGIDWFVRREGNLLVVAALEPKTDRPHVFTSSSYTSEQFSSPQTKSGTAYPCHCPGAACLTSIGASSSSSPLRSLCHSCCWCALCVELRVDRHLVPPPPRLHPCHHQCRRRGFWRMLRDDDYFPPLPRQPPPPPLFSSPSAMWMPPQPALLLFLSLFLGQVGGIDAPIPPMHPAPGSRTRWCFDDSGLPSPRM